MSITLYAKLDMTPGAVPTVVHRSQYDSDFTLVFSLYTRTGDFVIASGTTARMRGTKTSGTGYSVPVTLDVSAKTVTVTGDQQMTAAAGSNIFEIVLYQGDLEICSSNFVLSVERAAMDKDTITDATVVPELERLDEYIEQAAEVAAREGAAYAESWAVGGTGKRDGEDTNNAKYWAEQAQGAVSGVASFNGRTGAVVPATGDYNSTMIRRGNSTTTTVEDTLQVHENRTTELRSRMSTAEGNITSHGTRLTTAESNITSLQNNKVDKTTPLLNFDDTATDPLTDDGALANALTALGVLSDVIPSGGGSLYLKKILTKIVEEFETSTLTFVAADYEHLATNASVAKCGKTVTATIGPLTGLTQGTTLTLFTLPKGYRPNNTIIQDAYTVGTVASSMRAIRITINTNGTVTAYNYSTEAEILNMYTTITYICA